MNEWTETEGDKYVQKSGELVLQYIEERTRQNEGIEHIGEKWAEPICIELWTRMLALT